MILENVWIHEGNFTVDNSMIMNGKFIREKIPNIVKGDFICYNDIVSLEWFPVEVEGTCYVDNIFKIEKNYILSDDYEMYFDKYYVGLLKYCLDNKIDTEYIQSWPDNLLTNDLIKTTKRLINVKL